ncbi:acetyl-CoA carboxylase biotin carboxylase subunit [Paenarthrobacter sp. DKR-5]|uniref:acetyl-CoA carboxylase biotin carboxylase subunit n=1 Tax=Paenarthrobacter sp. DKR-5 TaxID=2835535 RepID=UPI001BDD28B3|nr:acetyl-CoA carboxylase biotin carboxylase subunit [Paenarthrobacter sp. DKR-5]MBT1001562.1 acetyl-CoA carboxylase biotin carboxylase subunit [Paenarthrobacter sp. DKR-5]
MEKLLIANRGEIAVRLIRTAREMGIRTVLVASEPDAASYASSLADECVVIGPAPASKSYLDQQAVLKAALDAGCDAVHPGYGFLSENAAFARAVVEAGLIWVGPSADAISLMGDKSRARQAAETAGVPILRGTPGALRKEDDVLSVADWIGYPLVVKAAAGGGGRGIRLVTSEQDLLATVEVAQAEAQAAFGSSDVYLEKFVQRARHVEVQILGDGENVIHLGDRDCSMQRRQQKIVEEAPAPDLPEAVREKIRLSSVELARECGYEGLGTVEFLYDPEAHEAAFIEMNTRLQVEHPVTEMITGLDLVREQLLIAAGGKLRLSQEDVRFTGHAFEFRLNAEDPENGFMPSPGALQHLEWPGGPGVRVDSGVVTGSVVAPFYDSLMAKLIVWAADRDEAIDRSVRALAEVRVEGVKTTLPLLSSLLRAPALRAVEHHSKFIETTPELTGASA